MTKTGMKSGWEPFKAKCPNCGKTVYVVDPHRNSAFCSKACKANWEYSKKFIDKRKFEPTPVK